MASTIEDIINKIEEYFDGCKGSGFSGTKIIVNRDEIDGLLEELRTKTPEEIRRYQKIISNKEAILADAQRKASEIINQAEISKNELVSEHQIMQQAYAQANEVVMIASKQAEEMLEKATADANNIRMSAINYTDEILKDIQTIVFNSMETTRNNSESYLKTMQGYLDTVVENRKELNPAPVIQEEAMAAAAATTQAPVSDAAEELKLDIPDSFFNKD